MKVLVTVLYDAKDADEAAELSKRLGDIPGAIWTRDNLDRVDMGALLDAGKSAALAQFRAIADTLDPLDQGGS